MIRKNQLAIAALAAVLTGAVALPLAAQDQAPASRPERFARLMKLVDKDGDGTISLAEAQEFAARRFDRLDTEHKGYLNLDAYEAPLRRAIERASETRRAALERALSRAEATFKARKARAAQRPVEWMDELLAEHGVSLAILNSGEEPAV
ncbi:MAG TPA: hypothetical protein VHT04_14150, partial [Stellaceae bacterium]|nr:hypothetical protein [Stellaceae bacterium]